MNGQTGRTGLILRAIAAFLACPILWCAAPVSACEVPVFSYALQNWPASLYDLTIVHNGALPADQQVLVNKIHDEASNSIANLDVRLVDISVPESAASINVPMLSVEKGEALMVLQSPDPRVPRQSRRRNRMGGFMGPIQPPPGVVVAPPPEPGGVPPEMQDPQMLQGMPDRPGFEKMPNMQDLRNMQHNREGGPSGGLVWSGPASLKVFRNLVDSPARQEVARRILGGDAAAWVFLESGDPAQDGPALQLLEGELKALEQKLSKEGGRPNDSVQPVLPDAAVPPQIPNNQPQLAPSFVLAEQGDQAARPAKAVKVAFSTVRVARDNPLEKTFITQLLSIRKELAQAKGPIVFPIFGCGRALAGITGPEISAGQIAAFAAFLCGDCSCMVKEMNPGFDMLFAVDWTSTNWSAQVKALVPPPAELPSLVEVKPVSVAVKAPVPPAQPAEKPARISPAVAVMALAAVILAVVLVAGFVIVGRNPRK